MNTKNILLGVVALALGGVAFGQQVVSSDSAGLIGKRRVDLGFTYVDLNKSSTDAFGTGVYANIPVCKNADIGVGYAYNWAEAHSDVDMHTLSTDVTTYFKQGAAKPFASLSLGYIWPDRADRFVWGARAGVEVALDQKAAVSASVGYDDDFKSGDNGSWDGAVGLSYWVNATTALTAKISWIEYGDMSYTVGCSIKF